MAPRRRRCDKYAVRGELVEIVVYSSEFIDRSWINCKKREAIKWYNLKNVSSKIRVSGKV